MLPHRAAAHMHAILFLHACACQVDAERKLQSHSMMHTIMDGVCPGNLVMSKMSTQCLCHNLLI